MKIYDLRNGDRGYASSWWKTEFYYTKECTIAHHVPLFFKLLDLV